MEEKYIELLLEKCSKVRERKSLLLNYSKEIQPFIDKLTEKAKEYGVEDIYLDCYNIEEEHNFLKNKTIKEIEESKYFDKSIWDTYAKKMRVS